MGHLTIYVLGILLVMPLAKGSSNGNNLFCYYTNWAVYRPSPAKFTVENIDASLCTHIMYAFLEFDTQGFYLPSDQTEIDKLIALKQDNHALKLIFSIGGAAAGSWLFETVSSTGPSRRSFAARAATFIRYNSFDGLDVDWEYPLTTNKQKFSLLLQALHEEFVSEASTSGQERLELTAATAAGKWAIDASYDMAALNTYLDFVLVMAYDLHGSWDNYIGLHSALSPSESWDTLCQEWTINYYIANGVSPSKLVLGLPSYGRSFTLCSASSSSAPYSVHCGAGLAGPYTAEPGFLSYQEICMNGWSKTMDAKQKVPYATSGNQWVGYDDKESLTPKMDFLKSFGLAGAMFWALDLDDFNNQCGDGNYPLIQAVKDSLSDAPTTTPGPTTLSTSPSTTPSTTPSTMPSTTPSTSPSTPPSTSPSTQPSTPPSTTPSTTPSTMPSTTPSTPPSTMPSTPPSTTPGCSSGTTPGTTTTTASRGFTCPEQFGFYPHPTDCSKFYQCAHFIAYLFTCSGGTLWNQTHKICDWPSNVTC